MKKNCWEFKKCGREVGGAKIREFGVCPSATEQKLHGIHSGKHGGRACWIIAGTYCNGSVQGSFAVKYDNCFKCEFYEYVKKTEGVGFMLTPILLGKLKDNALAAVK